MSKEQDVEVEDLDVDEETEEGDFVETTTASAIAHALNVDPKVFRRFMRAKVTQAGGTVGIDTPGSGSRYAIPVDEVPDLMAAFREWATPKPSKKAVVVEIDDEDYSDEDLDEEDFVLDEENSVEDEVDEDEDASEIEELG